MIQFNLLPDVKIAFIKAERQKRLVVSISVIASIAAVTVLVLLFAFVNLAQKKNMNDLTKDIKRQNANLMNTEDLNKILTVQGQLGALDELHSQKVISSRMFDYMQQVTPAQVSIAQLDVDFAESTITVSGTAENLASINTYVDSFKFTTFTNEETGTTQNAFSNVVLSSFARSSDRTSYTINLNFDPAIFGNGEPVKLTVPKMVTTRSNTERPSALFEQNIEGGQ